MNMNRKLRLSICLMGLLSFFGQSFAQNSETRWVDSVYNSLTLEQRVGQLMFARANDVDKPFKKEIENYIKEYNIGGVCFFRYDGEKQVAQTNAWQAAAQTPMMITIDGEWGLAMRIKGAVKYPYQMTLGAVANDNLIYRMGQQIAEQCQRMGIQVNFAPDVDVNSEPSNPVIGVRSFGENPQKVGEKGVAYALGMQSRGLITSMKHFPGHGNTATDSHYTLPVVNRPMSEVRDVDLAPFCQLIANGVNGAMVGHLYFPAIEKVENTASSLSHGIITGLLKDELGFSGLIFTDGLDMKGVSEKVRQDSVPYVSFMAGSDVLLLPSDLPFAIRTIKAAAERDPKVMERVEESCKKILIFKYRAGLNHYKPVKTDNVMADVNKAEYKDLRKQLYAAAVTQLRNESVFPLPKDKKIAVVTIGNTKNDVNNGLIDNGYDAKSYVTTKDEMGSKKSAWLKELEAYDLVVVNIEKTNNFAVKSKDGSQYGINEETVDFFNRLVAQNDVVLNLFACPYALDLFRINNSVKGLMVAYEDEVPAVDAVVAIMSGLQEASGTLPVSTAKFLCGEGIVSATPVPHFDPNAVVVPAVVGAAKRDESSMQIDAKFVRQLDSVALMGIEKKAYPGCQILAMKDGHVIYEKCFGTFTYESHRQVQPTDVYDIASCTKIFASTLAIMKLYEDGLLDLQSTLGDYFPYLNQSNKGAIKWIDILTHQSGMVAYIPFYKPLVDAEGPKSEYFSTTMSTQFPSRVAENLYLKKDFDTRLMDTLMASPMKAKKYVYCDMGFYFVPNLVKLLTNKSMQEYLNENFYAPMGLHNIGYCPLEWRTRETIVPTEDDHFFRNQLLWGDVHDEAAALMGGVSGHAGLFANARDLAVIMQMLLDDGVYQGKQILKSSTIDYFTTAPFTSSDNRRALGFDKLPIGKKGAATASKQASMASFGHTGFTGTFAWADPVNDLLIIFLSNRVYPTREVNKLSKLNIRTLLHDILYDAVE